MASLAALALLPDTSSQVDIVRQMAVCGAGFVGFQAPNNRTLITAAPGASSGGASGKPGTDRLIDRAVGAALVALLLGHLVIDGSTRGLALGRLGIDGTTWTLALGSRFAAVSAAVSALRLRHFCTVDPRAGGS